MLYLVCSCPLLQIKVQWYVVYRLEASVQLTINIKGQREREKESTFLRYKSKDKDRRTKNACHGPVVDSVKTA